MVENYVIRIYRRTNSDPWQVTGIAERAQDVQQQRLATIHELCEILTAPDVNGNEATRLPSRRINK